MMDKTDLQSNKAVSLKIDSKMPKGPLRGLLSNDYLN